MTATLEEHLDALMWREGAKYMDRIIAVYAATRNLYGRALNAMRSLLYWHPDAKVYLMTEDDREILERHDFDIPDQCQIVNAAPYRDRYIDPNGINSGTVFSCQALLRAAYPEIFTAEDKILSLDADTIVCGKITALWDMDMTGKWFTAVAEQSPPAWRPDPWRPICRRYFNAGVLVYNLEQMRQDGATAQCLQLLNSHRMTYIEQDAFNHLAVNAGLVNFAPIEYNNCIGCGYTDPFKIQHYAGVMSKWEGRRDFKRWELLEKYHGEHPRGCEVFAGDPHNRIA